MPTPKFFIAKFIVTRNFFMQIAALPANYCGKKATPPANFDNGRVGGLYIIEYIIKLLDIMMTLYFAYIRAYTYVRHSTLYKACEHVYN